MQRKIDFPGISFESAGQNPAEVVYYRHNLLKGAANHE